MEIKGSWKTTLSGVGAIITALGAALNALTDGNPDTAVNLSTTITAIMVGIGLIMARDNNKSSEDVGAK